MMNLSKWKKSSLCDLAKYINGKAFKPEQWGKSGLPIIRIQNLTDPTKPFNYFAGDIEDRYLVHTGDLLVSWSATLGSFIWNRGPAVLNQHIFKVIPKNELVEKDFLHYLMLNTLDEMAKQSHGLAMKHITKEKFEALEVMIPPVTEQRRIVARIKECMGRVEEIESLKTKALVDSGFLAESLIEAEFQNVVGETVSLNDICSITSNLVNPLDSKYIDMIHIGGANIEAKTSCLVNLKTAREENLQSAKYWFDNTMVLYNKIRPYLMKVARPEFEGLCSADMYPLTPNPKLLTRDYLFYLLLSRGFTNYAVKGSARAGMPKVNREHLFSFRFKLPSKEEQFRITQILGSALSVVEKMRSNLEGTNKGMATIRESILRKAFAGEL